VVIERTVLKARVLLRELLGYINLKPQGEVGRVWDRANSTTEGRKLCW